MPNNYSMPESFARYDSMGQLFSALRSNRRAWRGASDFAGRGTEGAMQYVAQGASDAEQAPVIALLDKIDGTVQDRTRREQVSSVTGSRVCVPDYLSGKPNAMRRRAHVESDVSPLRIVVESLVSGGVSESQLARRGAAITALAMRLSETRPVELWACWAMVPRPARTTYIGMVKLDTAPFSLGHTQAVMGSPDFARAITFADAQGRAKQYSRSIAWGWNGDPGSRQYKANMARLMGLEPQDIYLPGGHLTESDAWMRDPVAWVNKYLDAQRTLD